MTDSRNVVPGKTVMLTRRAVCRFYLFRPDAKMRQIFLYCLAVAAERHGILVHAAVLMSTHLHVVFTDSRGEYPDFLQRFHRLLANCTKAHRGWGHEVFDGLGSHILDLETPGAVIEESAYVVVNPVACGAVRYARQWPGVVLGPRQMGGPPMVIERPDEYFDPDGDMPERAVLQVHIETGLVALHGVEGAREIIAQRVEELEKEAQQKVAEQGHRFLGVDRVLKASPYRRAKSYEVFGALRPRFSTRGGTKQDYLDAVERHLQFKAAYREAWERWCAGDHEVVFPYGTWLMRVRFGARVAEPPD